MIKCWLIILAVRYRVIFDFFLNFVRRMNEVISLNVVFLNLVQRKLIHVPTRIAERRLLTGLQRGYFF